MKNEYKKVGQLITQILTVIIVFGIITCGLWRINLIRLPSFLDRIIASENEYDEGYTSDGYEIFKHIGFISSEVDAEFSYPAITPEKLSVLLDSVEPYDNFYWECTSKLIANNNKRIKKCKLRISGDKYNVEILDENDLTVRKCISDGYSTVIKSSFENGTPKSRIYKHGLFDYYSDASVISFEYFKNFNFTSDGMEIFHIEKDGFNLISINHSYERNGIVVKNNYLVSLDYGVVLFAECFENDELIYSLETKSINSISSLDNELFAVTK